MLARAEGDAVSRTVLQIILTSEDEKNILTSQGLNDVLSTRARRGICREYLRNLCMAELRRLRVREREDAQP